MKQERFDTILDAADGVQDLKQALILFAQMEMPERDFAANTREAYQRDLADLIQFLKGRGVTQIRKAGLSDLKHYQAEMERRRYKPSTQERKIYAIKAFFKFLEAYELIDRNPASRLIPPKVPEHEVRVLSEEEYQRLRQVCQDHPRDAAVIELLLQTGMRVSEVAGLRTSDIALPEKITESGDHVGIVRVNRTGGKPENIPLNYKACRALKAWLEVRPEVGHEALFVTIRKTRLKERDIQRRVKKHMQEAGIEAASVQTIRHTAATHMLAKGVGPKNVKEILGHGSLTTTSKYLHLLPEQLRTEIQKGAL